MAKACDHSRSEPSVINQTRTESCDKPKTIFEQRQTFEDKLLALSKQFVALVWLRAEMSEQLAYSRIILNRKLI